MEKTNESLPLLDRIEKYGGILGMLLALIQTIIGAAIMIGIFGLPAWATALMCILILMANLAIWAWRHGRRESESMRTAVKKIDELLNQEWAKRQSTYIEDGGMVLFIDDILKGLPVKARNFIRMLYPKYYCNNETTYDKKKEYLQIIHEYLSNLVDTKKKGGAK